MKNAITILLASLTLSGCFYQTVNSNDIDSANQICKNQNSTVVDIKATNMGNEYVLCSNRKSFRLE